MFPTSTTGTIPLVGAGVGWSSVDVSALKKKVRIEITKKHTVNKFLRYHSNTYVTKQMCKYTNIWDILCVYKYTNTLPSTMDHTFKTSVLYRKPPHKKKNIYGICCSNVGSSDPPIRLDVPNDLLGRFQVQPRCWVRQHHLSR